MKKLIIVFLCSLVVKRATAQTDEAVIRCILENLINCSYNYADTLLVNQRVSDTFFYYDSSVMVEKIGLQIPQEILFQISSNSKMDRSKSQWIEVGFNESSTVVTTDKDTILLKSKPHIRCLSKPQLDSTAIYSPTVTIYSISRLAFDQSSHTAVFEFSYGRAGQIFSSEYVLIQKVFGKWVVLQKFDWKIS